MNKEQLLKKWDEYLILHYTNNGTIKQYHSIVNNFLNDCDKDEIDFNDILKHSQKTPQSNKCEVLRIFASNILKINTGRCPKKSVMRMRLNKSLSVEEMKDFIKKIENDDVKLMLMIQYETACRIGSILNMRKRDVSVDPDGFVKIKMLEKGGNITTKYITKNTGDILLSKIEHIKKNDKVFDIKRKDPYHFVYEQMKKADDVITTHWFRHSRIMHLFNKGYDILEVQRVTNHKSLEALKSYLVEAGKTSKDIISKEKVDWN